MGIPGRRPDLLSARLDAHHGSQPDPGSAGGTLVALEPPIDLTPGALAIWTVVLPPLLEARVLRPDDIVLLIEFCETIAMARGHRLSITYWQKVIDDAEEHGATGMEEPKDFLARLEMMSMRVKRERAGYHAAMRLGVSLASEFGISPVARVRLGLAKVQGASLLDSLDRRVPSAN